MNVLFTTSYFSKSSLYLSPQSFNLLHLSTGNYSIEIYIEWYFISSYI